MKTDASQNYGSIVDVTYGGEGATLTVYTYTEGHQFVTLCRFSLGTSELQKMLTKIDQRRRDLSVVTEPLW